MVKKTNTMDMIKAWIPIIGVVIALGGGFIKYGEITTKLDALSEVSAPDLTPIAQSIGSANTDIAILKSLNHYLLNCRNSHNLLN